MKDQELHTVAIHIPRHGDFVGTALRQLNRVPHVGEYVCLGASETWHKVVVVVHCAFEAPCAAEVYTEEKGVTRSDVVAALTA